MWIIIIILALEFFGFKLWDKITAYQLNTTYYETLIKPNLPLELQKTVYVKKW